MASIPEHLRADELLKTFSSEGVQLHSRGKVRDTYLLDENRLLVVASDRVSIFDFVLGSLIPKKGEVLTALTHFWLTKVLSDFNNHLIRSHTNLKFNAAYDFKNEIMFDLPIERCLVVKNMTGKLYPFEMIYRRHIGGSVFKEYQKTGKASGHELPRNLPKWARLDKAIFTPSTKEEIGHDMNISEKSFHVYMNTHGHGIEASETNEMLKKAYNLAYACAEKSGILILDTKFEAAGPMLIDEILTPDSSRFVIKEDWEEAIKVGRDLYFYDKQIVRDWGMKVETPFTDKDGQKVIGINNLDPSNPDHLHFVHGLTIPEEIIEETTRRYLRIFELLTYQNLKSYQKNEMGVCHY